MMDSRSDQKTGDKRQKSLVEAQKEISLLRRRLYGRERDIARLSAWIDSLRIDIRAVFNSFSWKIGNFIIRTIAKALFFPSRTGIRDHVERTLANFKSWNTHYHSGRGRGEDLSDRPPWRNFIGYESWIRKYGAPDASDILRRLLQK